MPTVKAPRMLSGAQMVELDTFRPEVLSHAERRAEGFCLTRSHLLWVQPHRDSAGTRVRIWLYQRPETRAFTCALRLIVQ